ncbi:MAG: pyridoxamine 5'-phosphate oxidase family protein [Chloroflexota bacterium]
MSETVTTLSRFHLGEQALQSETGKLDKIERASRTMIRDYMPEQHRDFFAGLRYLFIGTVDQQSQPWSSILAGPTGFVTTPDAHTMHIDLTHVGSSILAEPAFAEVDVGSTVGVLGLDLSNRRRNRMHGRVTQITPDRLVIRVSQSFGNCPKYINTRTIDDSLPLPSLGETFERDDLSDADRLRITRVDTFFIASHHQDGSGADYEGADVSHRGGASGFVHIEDDNSLTIPDYMGNYMFNTLGNLLLDPKTGLLFIDFDNGDLMQINGKAEIIRDANEVASYPGAHRLLRIHVDYVRYTPGGLPLRWQFLEPSPYSPVIAN